VAGATLHKINLGSLTAQASQWPLDSDLQTLVFIHGAGFHAGFWHPQESLANQFNVIFLNLPGRQSAAPSEGLIERYADEAAKALKQLETNVIIIGHSMGGAVAQAIAHANPPWLQAIVLACTGAKLKVAPVVNQLLTQGASVFMQMFTQTGPGLDIKQMALLGNQMAKTETGLTDFLACNRFDFMDRVNEIRTPCLVMTGDKDLLTPEKYSHFLHEHITGSELSLVKDTGHLLPWESPITFNRLISEFARRHEPDSVSITD